MWYEQALNASHRLGLAAQWNCAQVRRRKTDEVLSAIVYTLHPQMRGRLHHNEARYRLLFLWESTLQTHDYISGTETSTQ